MEAEMDITPKVVPDPPEGDTFLPYGHGNLRPSYMDNGISNISSGDEKGPLDFDLAVKRKLEDDLIDDDFDETGYCIKKKFEDVDTDENIRTYLRIRPVHGRSSVGRDGNLDQGRSEAYTIVNPYTVTISSNTQKKPSETSEARFTFTRVFNSDSTQATVYEESTTDLVNSFLAGHNALLFSYGATNSGKTYTMQGYGKEFGIVPRTLDTIFSRLDHSVYSRGDIKPSFFDNCIKLDKATTTQLNTKKLTVIKSAKLRQGEINDFVETVSLDRSRHSESAASLSFQSRCSSISNGGGLPESQQTSPVMYAVWVSFAEIYNERIFDLFEPITTGKKTRKELKLYHDKEGRLYIKDLTEYNVNNAAEAYRLFLAGKRNLQQASTKANLTSSRSHSFFNVRIIRLEQSGDEFLPRQVCRFTFCDLAGVERVSQTGNVGLRLKESGNINQSVGVLIRCIRAVRLKQLGGRQDIPPYRDSKLARLFQSYLTTGTKVCMIVNVNPTVDLIETNLQILHNSAIASQVKTFNPVAYPVLKPNSSFSKRVRASIGAQHRIVQVQEEPIEEAEEEESEDDESEDEGSTVKKKQPIVRRMPVTVHDENEKLLEENMSLKRKVLYIEQEVRESMQAEFAKILDEQKEYYDNLIKDERMTKERFTKRRISVAAQIQRRLDTRTPKKESVIQATSPPRNPINESGSTVDNYCTPESSKSGTPRSLLTTPGTTAEDYRRELQKAKIENKDLVEVVGSLRSYITELNNTKMELELSIKKQEDFIRGLLESNENLKELLKVREAEIGALTSTKPLDSSSLYEQLTEAKTKIMELNEELQQGVEVVTEYDLKLSEANTKLEQLTREYNRLYTEHQGLEEDQKYLMCAMETLQAKQLNQKENVDHK